MDPWSVLVQLAKRVWNQRKPIVEHEVVEAEIVTQGVDVTESARAQVGTTPDDAMYIERTAESGGADEIGDDTRDLLTAAVSRLPPRERTVIQLHFFGDESGETLGGLGYSQIAQRLRIKESAARQYAMQGRRRLLAILEESGDANQLMRRFRGRIT